MSDQSLPHPQWILKIIHNSKVHAVKIVTWENHHEIAVIRDVYEHNGEPSEGKQAAQLIASAPELLKALERILNAPDYMIGQIAREAIAKAKG